MTFRIQDYSDNAVYNGDDAVAAATAVCKLIDRLQTIVYEVERREDGDNQRAMRIARDYALRRLDDIAQQYVALGSEYPYGTLLVRSAEDIVFEILAAAEKRDCPGIVLDIDGCQVIWDADSDDA